jgi:hypothetical protein
MGIWRKVRWRRKVREVEGKLKGRDIERETERFGGREVERR